MKRKFFHDISTSAFQVILNQGFGLIIFLLTSRFLAKDVYGEMNWSLAALGFSTTILSLRLEQVVVKRVAAGENASKLLTLFTGHVFFSGLAFYLILLIASFVWPSFFRNHDLLLLLAISHLLSFFSSPFKQLANGKEDFRILAVMSSVSNAIRSVWLLVAVLVHNFSIGTVLIVYIISSFVELLACYLLSRYCLKIPFDAAQNLRSYRQLIQESLPMAGAVVLHATIARVDWILLGLFTTSIQTAEYSFAYRVFELSPVPLLIMAPVLLSRFSRFFSTYGEGDLLLRKKELSLLIRMSMIIATVIPLVLNIAWTPLVDTLTNGKYGAVNARTFLILSCCLPFLYMNNILWTIHLAQNRLRRIFFVTLITFLIILGGDLLVIPAYAAMGAATVYLVATMVEYGNYMRKNVMLHIHESYTSPFTCILAAFLSGWVACLLPDQLALRIIASLLIFCLLLLATKQLRKSDWIHIRDAITGKSIPGRPNST